MRKMCAVCCMCTGKVLVIPFPSLFCLIISLLSHTMWVPNLQFNKQPWESEVSCTEFEGSYNPSSSRIWVTIPKRGAFYTVVTIIIPEYQTACPVFPFTTGCCFFTGLKKCNRAKKAELKILSFLSMKLQGVLSICRNTWQLNSEEYNGHRELWGFFKSFLIMTLIKFMKLEVLMKCQGDGVTLHELRV